MSVGETSEMSRTKTLGLFARNPPVDWQLASEALSLERCGRRTAYASHRTQIWLVTWIAFFHSSGRNHRCRTEVSDANLSTITNSKTNVREFRFTRISVLGEKKILWKSESCVLSSRSTKKLKLWDERIFAILFDNRKNKQFNYTSLPYSLKKYGAFCN